MSSLVDGVLVLEALDRVLRPLRRVLVYALRDGGASVQFFEANAGRWVRAAQQLDGPGAVREGLAAIAACLPGFDAVDAAERLARLRAMNQELGRIDATLGLPLLERVAAPVPSRPGDHAPEGVDEGPGRFPLDAQGAPDDEEIDEDDESDDDDRDDEAQRRLRLGDPSATGRAIGLLADVGAHGAALAEEGVETVADLLLLPPVDEEVLRLHGAGRELPEGRVAVGGRVRRRWTVLSAGSRQTHVLLQGAGLLQATWQQGAPAWVLDRLSQGTRTVLAGDIAPGGDGRLLDPELAAGEGHSVRLQRYGIEGVDDRIVRGLVWQALPEAERVRDPLPDEIIDRVKLPALGDALRDLHHGGPPAGKARQRLAFDEALLVQLGLAAPRYAVTRERGVTHAVVNGLTARACQFIEVELDDSQQLALEEIKRDLHAPAPMLRLLVGEAGGGKALVALLAGVMVAEGKSQVMFLCPDAASAELRLLFAEPMLREVGLVGRIVTGDPSKAQRDALRRGEVHVVFGTLDLLDQEVEFRRLGLVIAEESLAYGRAPVRVAAMRAPRPDLLVLASTPVPAGVLLAAYGDHDVSIVDGGVGVAGTVFEEGRRAEVYERASASLKTGRQVWMVFPQSRGTDVLDAREAHQVVEALQAEVFPTSRVALFHSGMSREDRARAYEDFRLHRTHVLVATSPIEDGPPIPNATVMIVEQADRMTIERLQRLRGHVSAGLVPGEVLYVVGQTPDPAGVQAVAQVADGARSGWAIGEWALKERGLEAVLAREVPAAARLRWLDPSEDRDLLIRAREEAHRMLEDDPGLRRGAHGDLARALRERWTDLLSIPYPLSEGGVAPLARRRRRRRKRK